MLLPIVGTQAYQEIVGVLGVAGVPLGVVGGVAVEPRGGVIL